MAKHFNKAFADWLDDFYSGLNSSPEKRADMNEVIVNLGYDNSTVENHTDLIKGNFTILISLYHILNRNPKKIQSLLEILNDE